MAIALAIVVLGGALAIALWTTWYLRAGRAGRDRPAGGWPGWPEELIARRRELGARLAALPARLPPLARPPVEDGAGAAGAVLTALAAGRADAALAAAEAMVAADPTDGDARALLARALLAADQVAAAHAAARAAAALGATGARLDLVLGLAGHRARVASAPAPAGVETPYDALLTPFELFVLELERRRQGGQRATDLWLAGLGEHTLPAGAILAAVTAHVAGYCDDLEHLLAAAEAEPTLLEASHHAARLGVKLGFVEPARAVFEALAPLMPGSIDEHAFAADLATLRDENLPISSTPPPPIASGTRSRQLKVVR